MIGSAMWGAGTFVETKEGLSHQLNAMVVSDGLQFDNAERSAVAVAIDVQLATRLSGRPPTLVLRTKADDVRLRINTGMKKTVLHPNDAARLGLPPPSDAKREALGIDGKVILVKEYEALIRFGSKYHPITLVVPVESTGQGAWRFKTTYKGSSLLGMYGILTSFMLCITPERLFLWRQTR